MAGKAKIRIYEYSIKGKLLNTYDSMNDASIGTYGKKRPLFQEKEYHITPSGSSLFKERMRRDVVFRFFQRLVNPLILRDDWRVVELVNMDGDVVAEFASIKVASALTGDKYGTIHGSAEYRICKSLPKNKLRYKYRYKEQRSQDFKNLIDNVES